MKASSFITKETALLESMMSGTDKDTRRYLKNMHESFVVPYNAYLTKLSRRIDEAQLTADQITKLFGVIAGGPGAQGGTVLPDSIKQKFDDALPPPDAGPVQGFEQKAAQAAQQVQDPKAKQGLMDLIKQGLQNPATQKLIMTGITGIVGVASGALTGGLGGVAGATAAGALTGGLMGVINAKMQGADWKSAGMAGLKGVGMGALAGGIGGIAGNLARDAIDSFSGGGGNAAAQAQADADQASMDNDTNNLAGGKNDQLGARQSGTPTSSSGSFTSQDSDAEDFSGTATPQQQAAADDAIYQQAKAAGATGSTTSQSFSGPDAKDQAFAQARSLGGQGVSPTDSGSSGASKGVDYDTPTDYSKADEVPASDLTPKGGSNQQADWAKGNNPPPDWIKNNATGQYAPPPDHPGNPDDWSKGINPPPEWEKNSATGKYEPPAGSAASTGAAPQGASMDPAYLQKVVNGEPGRHMITPDKAQAALDWQAQNGGPSHQASSTPAQGSGGYSKEYLQSVVNGTHPRPMVSVEKAKQLLGQSYVNPKRMLENVDRDLTIRMWALNESLGKPRGGVQITEAGMSGLIGSIKNFFKDGASSKGKSAEDLTVAWQRAGSPTDSEQLAEFLKKQGIADDIIASAYKQAGIPAPGEKVEPEMGAEPAAQPEQPAQPAQAEPAQTAADQAQQGQQAQAGGGQAQAAQAAQQQTSTGTVFDNPEQLAKDFEEYMAAGGKISPQFRGAIKAALQTGFKVVESKQRKLLKVLKEARRIDAELKKIKKQKL